MDEARRQWFRQRIEAVNARVSAYDVLRANGVQFNQPADDQEEQFSCPFHGKDAKPSARIYPASGERASHAWCFVCQEKNWDAIGLWRKFNEAKTFGQALSQLERAYGLQAPEAPVGAVESLAQTEVDDHFKRMYVACEVLLVNSKAAYRDTNDMKGYLTIGSILDRTRYKVDSRQWSPDRGVEILATLRTRIKSKVSTCPAG